MSIKSIIAQAELPSSSLQQQRSILRDRIADATKAGIVREVVAVEFMLYEAAKKAVAILDEALAAKAASASDLSTAHDAIVESLDAAPAPPPRAPIAPMKKPPLPLGAAPTAQARMPAPRKMPPRPTRQPTGPYKWDEEIPF